LTPCLDSGNIHPFWKYTILEVIVSKRTITQQVSELTEIFQHILYLRPHLKAVMPENMAAMKAYLDEERGKGKASAMNFNLFYNIGVILTREPCTVTMGELGYALNVPLSTATRITDWMVEHGYVQRQRDPNDRRIVRICLTDTGQELYRTINHFILERVEGLLSKFTLKERDDLIILMRKLMSAMETEMAKKEGPNQ
jgi:DNA-binding MarR family transcriptional regulator